MGEGQHHRHHYHHHHHHHNGHHHRHNCHLCHPCHNLMIRMTKALTIIQHSGQRNLIFSAQQIWMGSKLTPHTEICLKLLKTPSVAVSLPRRHISELLHPITDLVLIVIYYIKNDTLQKQIWFKRPLYFYEKRKRLWYLFCTWSRATFTFLNLNWGLTKC